MAFRAMAAIVREPQAASATDASCSQDSRQRVNGSLQQYQNVGVVLQTHEDNMVQIKQVKKLSL